MISSPRVTITPVIEDPPVNEIITNREQINVEVDRSFEKETVKETVQILVVNKTFPEDVPFNSKNPFLKLDLWKSIWNKFWI